MKSRRRKAKRPTLDATPIASATECTGLMPALLPDGAGDVPTEGDEK